MAGEKSKSVRQDWLEFSGAVQDDINETLADLQLEIERANAELSDCYQEDTEKFGDKVAEVINFLDGEWDYMGDYFLVSGNWYVPNNIVINNNGIQCYQEKAEAFNIVRSNGFIVYPYQVDDIIEPRVGLSFIVGSRFIGTAAIQGNFELLAVANLEEISLQYMRPYSPESVGASIEEVSQAVLHADELLKTHVNDSSSGFFSASAEEQGEFLRSVIDLATSALPPVESLDRVTLKDITPSMIYVRDPAQNKLLGFQGNEEYDLVIEHGIVLGFTTIDTIKDGIGKKRYKAPNQLSSTDEGLCAIVNPLRCNFDLSEYNNPDLIVPLRKIKGSPDFNLESHMG